MTTRMTINGVSTCQAAGTEKYESFQSGYGRKKAYPCAVRLPPYGRRVVFLRETDIERMPNSEGQMAEQQTRKGGGTMNATYQTIIVKFKEAIAELDSIFSDVQFWGVATLKEWIDDYESTRFTQTDSHTAVITSEYNMECVKEWLRKHSDIAELTEY